MPQLEHGKATIAHPERLVDALVLLLHGGRPR
jgi:hypothetical protein